MFKYALVILTVFCGVILLIIVTLLAAPVQGVGNIPPTLDCKNDHNCRIEYHGALADKHVRTTIVVNGEWFITDDLFPENFRTRHGR